MITRSEREIRKHDLVIATLSLGECRYMPDFERAWVKAGDNDKAHLYRVSTTLYARGTVNKKAFADGFFAGWRASELT